MALNEVALADKIAAIMSGNFLPPPVASKGKKKGKGHRKSSSLGELPSASDIDSDNGQSLNGDDTSDVSSQPSSVNPSIATLHRSLSSPNFEESLSLDSQQLKVKSKVSFIPDRADEENSLGHGAKYSGSKTIFGDNLASQISPSKIPRNLNQKSPLNSTVQLLESGDDFNLFNSSTRKELKLSHINGANDIFGEDTGRSTYDKNVPSRDYTEYGSFVPKPSVEPTAGNVEIKSDTNHRASSGKSGGGRIVKPTSTSTSFDVSSSFPDELPKAVSVDDSSKRLQRLSYFESSINSSTPVGKPLAITTSSVPRNPHQRRLSMPNSPATANKYRHELLTNPNNNTPSTFQSDRLVKVAVRVRPFLQEETENGDRRTLSKVGDNLVIVNPSAFEADPDAIAAAALALDNKNWAHVFEFDYCLWSYSPENKIDRYYDQEEVHVQVGHEIVDSVLQGVSASCFAYGHTSTGKTYSLFGNVQTPKEAKNDKYNYLKLLTDVITPELGLIPRVFSDIVTLVQDRDGGDTKLYFSFVEIYNEKIRDLLVDSSAGIADNSRDNHSVSAMSTPSSYYKPQISTPQQQHQGQNQGESLKVREHPIFGPYIENLQKVEVFTSEEVLRLIARGLSNRSTAKTHWNAHSSRSHTIVTLELSPSKLDQSIHILSPPTKVLIPQVHKHINIPNTPYSNPYHSIQKKSVSSELHHDHSSLVRVQMVDLAGSEKDPSGKDDDNNSHVSMHNSHSGIGMNRSDSASYGGSEKEKIELKHIRKSLTTLGFIIKSLARGASPKTMPYRDTVLTYLMKDALNGTNHTTLLATISPSSNCYEETLCTLRYAEHLCLLRRNTSQPFSVTKPYISSLVGGDKSMQGSRQSLLEDFPHIHEDLGFSKKSGSVASRQLLRQTVSDPQQRIAKMTKSEHSTERFRFDDHGNPVSSAKEKMATTIDLHDMEEMNNSHRQLQSDYIELQIDLDAVKTDRDTLMVELKTARDRIQAYESDKSKSKVAAIQLSRSLKSAETDLNDLRTQMARKEDNIERLMNDLADEKQARLNADNGYQARIKEFLSRFESMKNEISILNGNLDEANKRYRYYQEEKAELVNSIEELKERINKMVRDKESLLRQIERMSDERDALKKDLTAMKDLRAFNEELARKLKETQSHVQSLQEERENMLETISHKDSLFSIQQQKSETIITTLNQRIVSLEKIEIAYNEHQRLGINPEEYFRMQNQLRELFTNEGKILYSERIDTEKLTVMIRDMRRKLQDFEALQKDYNHELTLRQAAESEKVDLAVSLRSSEEQKQQLHTQIDSLKAQHHAQANDLTQQVQSLQSQHRSELTFLKEQLIAAQRESSSCREELLTNREASQKEFSSLWKSIQELNDLDLLKDKSIQDLIADRDRAILERDHAQNRVKMVTVQCESLQREMEEIDNDLLVAVESEESKMSTTGNYVVLHNVSDRMMHGLARRQIDKRHQLQGLLSTSTFGSAAINPSSQYSPDATAAAAAYNPHSRSSAATVASQSSASTFQRGKIQRPSSPAANSMTSGSYRSSVNSSSVPVAPLPGREKTPPPLPTYMNSSNSSLSGNGMKGMASPARVAPVPLESTSRSPLYGGKIQSSIQTTTTASQKQQQHQYQQQQQHHQQQQQHFDRDVNFSDDYNLSEKILERQIEELSDFLHDETKLKQARHRSTISGMTEMTSSTQSYSVGVGGGGGGRRAKDNYTRLSNKY